MKVIATRQLHGVYGTKLAGEEFDVHPDIGKKLLKDGLVRQPSADGYDVKAIQPFHAEPPLEAPTPAHVNKRGK